MDSQETRAYKQLRPIQSHFFRVLRERWWVIVLCVAVILGAVLSLGYRQTPQYKATARIVREQASLERALFGSQFFQVTDYARELLTGASSVTAPGVATLVKQELNSPRTPAELSGMVTATPSGQSDVISITAVSTSAQEASEVASSFARQFIVYRADADKQGIALAQRVVEKQLANMTAADLASDLGRLLLSRLEQFGIIQELQTGGYTLSQPAFTPRAPFSPQPLRNGVIAVVVGLVLGSGLAFLLGYLDKRIKDEETLETCYNLPVLASIPRLGAKWRGGTNGRRSNFPGSFASNPSLFEPFRALRSTLQYFDVDKDIRSILVTSGLPREGKTVTAVNLALSLAFAGNGVVLLEADLRRPVVAEYLNAKNEVGLSTVLAGGTTLKDALQSVPLDAFLPKEIREKVSEVNGVPLERSLYFLAAGPLPPNPAELLSSNRMEKLLRELNLSKAVDYLVIDTPPVLSVADALAIASHVDAVILTARINSTTRDEAWEVRNQLGRVGAHVIGVVAVGVKARSSYYRSAAYA